MGAAGGGVPFCVRVFETVVLVGFASAAAAYGAIWGAGLYMKTSGSATGGVVHTLAKRLSSLPAMPAAVREYQVEISLERLDRLTAPCGRSPLLTENVSTRPRACLQSSLIMVPLRAQASYVLLHTKSLLLLRSDHRPYR